MRKREMGAPARGTPPPPLPDPPVEAVRPTSALGLGFVQSFSSPWTDVITLRHLQEHDKGSITCETHGLLAAGRWQAVRGWWDDIYLARRGENGRTVHAGCPACVKIREAL